MEPKDKYLLLFGFGCLLVLIGMLFLKNDTQQDNEFRFNAGQEMRTAWMEPGHCYRITANHPIVVISFQPDGTTKEYPTPAGNSSWRSGSQAGPLHVRGLEDGTVLRFEKMQ